MCFVVMDPLVLLHQKGALSREQDQYNVAIDAWKKKKACLVQKWLMHERKVNKIKEIKRSEKERESRSSG